VEFRILGPLKVLEHSHQVPLGGSKQRALLAALLLHPNEVVSRDRLIDELWGASPPDTAQTALQVHVSQLRKALGRGLIFSSQPRRQRRLALQYWAVRVRHFFSRCEVQSPVVSGGHEVRSIREGRRTRVHYALASR
jgi:two-component SAPR family response regulator